DMPDHERPFDRTGRRRRFRQRHHHYNSRPFYPGRRIDKNRDRRSGRAKALQDRGRQRIYPDSADNGDGRRVRRGDEKYDDNGDVPAGRYRACGKGKDTAVKASDAARIRRDPRRKLYADRYIDEPRRQRNHRPIWLRTFFDVRTHVGWRHRFYVRAFVYAVYRPKASAFA